MGRTQPTPDRPALAVLPETAAHRHHRLRTMRIMQANATRTDWVGLARDALHTGPLWWTCQDLAALVGCSHAYLSKAIRRGVRSTEFAWANEGSRPRLIALASRVTEGARHVG